MSTISLVAAGSLGLGAPASAASGCPGGSQQPPGVGTGTSVLFGVAVAPGCTAWAVGAYQGAGPEALIDYWNGTAWAVQPAADPGTTWNVLRGVTATSATSAWAVGMSKSGSLVQTLIERWDGTAWTQVPSPDPGTTGSILSAVSGDWAVGSYSDGSTSRTLIAHWDGSAWTQVPSPDAGTHSNYLTGVAATSATSVWAVGYYFTGTSVTTAYKTLIEHWNGTVWRRVASPSPAGAAHINELLGVAATSSSSAWAVGYTAASQSANGHTLIEHWNGTAWQRVASPNPGMSNGSYLEGVSAVTDRAWAVGNYSTGSTRQTLVMRWTGTAWRRVASADPAGAGGDNFLSGVAADASGGWAVGQYAASGAFPKPLGEPCC